MVDKKLEAFNKNKVENYKESCRLEGLRVEAAPHPDNHERHEVRLCKFKEAISPFIDMPEGGWPHIPRDINASAPSPKWQWLYENVLNDARNAEEFKREYYGMKIHRQELKD